MIIHSQNKNSSEMKKHLLYFIHNMLKQYEVFLTIRYCYDNILYLTLIVFTPISLSQSDSWI